MKLSINSNFLAQKTGLLNAVDLLADAGFDAIDFSAFEEEYYTDAHDKSFYRNVRRHAADRGLTFNQAHAPFPSSYGEYVKDTDRFAHIVHSMEIASWLGVRTIVVHPVQHLDYATRGNPEKLFDMNMNFYRRLIPFCELFDIRVAVENMWQYPKTVSHSTCSRPEEFLRYMEGLNSPHFVACLDTGHALLVKERPDDVVRTLGNKHLQALHVQDIDGIHDTHTLPYCGITDWESFLESLAGIDYQGDLTYEANSFMSSLPPALYPEALKYMVSVGRYMIGRFEAYKAG